MKNNQNLVSFSPVKGVYLYFADSNMTDIIDINVEPGIRSIVLSGPNANRNRLSRNVKGTCRYYVSIGLEILKKEGVINMAYFS